MLRRLLIPLVVVAFIAGGCNRGTDSKTKLQELGKLSDTIVERHLTVDVSGDRTFHFDAQTKMRFVVRKSTGSMKSGSVASVSVPEMIPNGADGSVMPEVGIATRYTGDGSYVVAAGTGQAPPGGPAAKPDPEQSPDVSLVQVTFIDNKPTPSEHRFGYLLESCKVTLKDNARSGSAVCPALLTVKDERVKLTMSWGAS